VSSLLQGSKSALIPENNERMNRRRQLELVRPPEEELGGCSDQGGCDGDSASEDGSLLSLGVLRRGCGS
jgi:hypothetical protein